MIIFSELTNKQYDSVKDCLAAEKEFKAKEDTKRAELDKAYEEAIAACDRYLELAGIKVDMDIDIDEDENGEDPFDILDMIMNDLKELFEQKGLHMTNEDKILMLKVRLHKLENNGKNFDSPGVVRKLKRQLRNLER